MPEILHHDAELADFLRVGAGREIFRGIRVRKANYVKAHGDILARLFSF